MITFVYTNLISFEPTVKVKSFQISVEFAVAILKNLGCDHYSHMTGKIVGCAHSFYNQKVRENYCKIPAVADNLFHFDFFFLMKGMRASVWKTRDSYRW